MKFRISATSIWHDESLLAKYPMLSDFGYGVEDITFPVRTPIYDEAGKRMYQTGERIVKKPYVIIDSIEQLVEFMRAVDTALVISPEDSYYGTYLNEIEIYDTYRE